jgi:hypothetical protein
MSFLSRRPSRPGNRASDAGRDDPRDDYDYAPDGYARGDEDENWSANEYFSPEGIKGRRAAGHQPGEQPAVRGDRDSGRGNSVQRNSVQRNSGQRDPGRGGYPDSPDGAGHDDNGHDSYGAGGRDHEGDSFQGGAAYGGYGTDEYATGAYDLPDGADDERAERTGRKRKDRAERGSRLRLRRDRGEDIWPDDGVSDEDYWASVASDKPLTPTKAPGDAGPTPAVGDSRSPAPPGDQRPVDDARFGGDPRGGAGRLGPAPGLVGNYQPASGTGAMSGLVPPGRSTGPHAVRPGQGSAGNDRLGSGSGSAWSGQAARSSGGFPQAETAQPTFRPNVAPSPGGPAGARSQDRSDWGERTERIERVTASGYPDPRQSSRSNGTGPGPGIGPVGALGPSGGAPGRGRTDSGSWRAAGNTDSGSWRAAGNDDPLTSTAYSRSALTEADGRSYRVAARRSEAQAQLTDETQTFGAPVAHPGDRNSGARYSDDRYSDDRYSDDRYSSDPRSSEQYQSGQRPRGRSQTGEHPAARYPSGLTGEYGQYSTDKYSADTYAADTYRGGQQRGDAQEPTAQYPAYGSQPPGQQPGRQPGRQPGQQPGQAPWQGQAGSARYPGHAQQPGQSGQPSQTGQAGQQSQPSQPGSNSGRVSLPGASDGLTGPFPAQQPRQPQQTRQQQPAQQQPQPQPQPQRPQMQPPRQPVQSAQSALPAGGNPYDSAVTGSYPYPGQAGYSARSAPSQVPAAPDQNGRDDRRRRTELPDGYGADNPDQGGQQGRGTGDGYGAPRDGRY